MAKKPNQRKQRIRKALQRQREVQAVQNFQNIKDHQPKAITQTHQISKKDIRKLGYSQSRIHRSRTQNMYLMKAELQINRSKQEWWRFTVCGASMNDYNVHINKNCLSCCCPDFYLRGNICKHIYFIITQVAKSEEVGKCLKKNTKRLKPEIFEMLNNALKCRLRRIIQAQQSVEQEAKEEKETSKLHEPQQIKAMKLKQQIPKKIDIKEDEPDCMICFLQMSEESELLTDCSQCRKYFHEECLAIWKKKSLTCPYCRLDLNKIQALKDKSKILI